MKRAAQLSMIAFALVAVTGAVAQRIEISSPSIGTVIVTPPRINAAATPVSGTQAARNRPTGRGAAGVDLGIQRRPDGTLYDPLDPTQNPAAATANPATIGAGDQRQNATTRQ